MGLRTDVSIVECVEFVPTVITVAPDECVDCATVCGMDEPRMVYCDVCGVDYPEDDRCRYH